MSKKEKKKECCGNCKHYQYKPKEGWICKCPYSDCYHQWTDYGNSCEEYEKK